MRRGRKEGEGRKHVDTKVKEVKRYGVEVPETCVTEGKSCERLGTLNRLIEKE